MIELDTPWGEAHLPALTRDLPDGRTGYYQTYQPGAVTPRDGAPHVGCWAAAWATAMQVPPEEFPEFKTTTTEDALRFLVWVGKQGWAIGPHTGPATHADLWIGHTAPNEDGWTHCLVCERDEILFDPNGLTWPNEPDRVPKRRTVHDCERAEIFTPTGGSVPWR